jgi:hypothetical protein
MKISELPKKIRKKALKYQKKDGDNLETDLLHEAFTWQDTKEGQSYWDYLDDQKPPKKELKPKFEGGIIGFNKPKDTIVESVIEQFKKRSEVGIKKYNTTLDRTDLTRLEWLQHAQEEAMDLILYLEKLKQYDKE